MIKRFIFFHGKRHPRETGAAQVQAFLSHLAVDGHVAASTQNQALNALVFLYNEVLHMELGALDELVRDSPALYARLLNAYASVNHRSANFIKYRKRSGRIRRSASG